ncbi:MAG: hypothetical protein ACTSP8_02495 [Promethearchaeota archaeon]
MINKQKINAYKLIGLKKPSNPNLTLIGRVLFYAGASYIVLMILNVVLSLFFGFSLTANYISDLGSKFFIPFPYIHNLICVFGGLVSIPINFFVKQKLRITYKSSRYSALFLEFGVVLGVIGNVGYVFLGVFSLDRAGPGDIYHSIISSISFGGYIFSIFFISLNIVLSHKCKLKRLGLFGLVIPMNLLLLYCIISIPLIEWFLLSSILAFLLMLNFYVFKL